MAHVTIPSKAWPYKEAKTIIKIFGESSQPYILETGFGASGFPHIGTLGEAAKTWFVILALQDMGYDGKMITFSDDMDGLRKLPQGFPSSFTEHLSKPVSLIPDPFDKFESFASHVNHLARNLIDRLEIPYEFKSSLDQYQKGVFNKEIEIILHNYETLKTIVLPTIAPENRQQWAPFFPICERCGRLYTARITEIHLDCLEISYHCDLDFGETKGCGHAGRMSALNGNGKLPWKIDWAARWNTFGVNYELYGKDLVESARVSKQIVSKVFHGKPPAGLFYELFLAEDGSKISKSKGQGISVDEWLQYGSLESLLLIMYKNPQRAKKLTYRIIPQCMDEILQMAALYHTDEPDADSDPRRREYRFISLNKPDRIQQVHIDFSALCNLAAALRTTDTGLMAQYLEKMGMTVTADNQAQIDDLLQKAVNFYRDLMSTDLVYTTLTEQEHSVVQEFIAYLHSTSATAEKIHNHIYELAKQHQLQPNRFFEILYHLLIGQKRGPRLGMFIEILGQKFTAERLTEELKNIPEQTIEDQTSADIVHVADDVRTRFTDLIVGFGIFENLRVKRSSQDLKTMLNSSFQQHLTYADEDAIMQEPRIQRYREIFKGFGVNPNQRQPSVEAMVRRLQKRSEFLFINNLVDIGNLLVLKYRLSIGMYDLDKVKGTVTLTFAANNDRFKPISAKDYESIDPGELIYKDSNEVICRDLNYRDSDSTKITTKTKRALVLIDGVGEQARNEVQSVLQELSTLIDQYCNGQLIQSELVE